MTDPLVANLSASLDTPVRRHPNVKRPDGIYESYTDGTTIWLADIYVRRIGGTEAAAKRELVKPLWFRAQAIYLLLHEHGHVLQHRRGVQNYPGFENEANVHAANMFRWYCHHRLSITQDGANRLWVALPDYYRHPEGV